MAAKEKELVLATANTNKIKEIREILPPGFALLTLQDVNITLELPETTGTISGNALQKARTVFELTGKTAVADDTGLIVTALDGLPSVDSAFFAGMPRSDERNMEKLLRMLTFQTDRSAFFLCTIALVGAEGEYLFEGRLEGSIADVPAGSNGFGYDPVFIPEGEIRTLAMMSREEKNRISHRARALNKLVLALETMQFPG